MIKTAVTFAFAVISTTTLGAWTAPGFVIDDAGFRSNWPSADTFRFAHPLSGKVDKQEKYATEISCRLFAPNPKSVWIGSWAPGFEFYLPYGLELGLGTLVGPNLTVRDASYGPGQPTPATRWILLTFADTQPPVLFVFLGEPGQLVVEGASGAWKLRTPGRYRGRVRVCLPFGLKALSGNNVGTLGRFAAVVSRQESLWCAPRPRLLSTESSHDEAAVKLRYTFDRPGAVMPPVAILAKAGGNTLRTLTPVNDPARSCESGPIAFSASAKIELEFPLRRVPAARGVASGEVALGQAASTADAHAGRSLRALLSFDAPERPDPAHEVSGETADPLDLQAAHLLQRVAQARAFGPFPSGETVPRILRKWNPVTWCLNDTDPAVSERATALASVCAAIEPDGVSELYGAMMCAGLDAKRALVKFCQSRELSPVPPLPVAGEPYLPLLRALYSVDAKALEQAPLLQGLLSPVRLLSGQALSASPVPMGTEVRWTHGSSEKPLLVFAVDCPCTVLPGDNVERVESTESFGVLTVRYLPKVAGPCSLILKLPKWARQVPALTGPPLFPAP